MLPNSWFKKEKPLTGLLGSGGGIGSRLVSAAALSEGPFAITGGNTVVTTPTHKFHCFTSSGSIVVAEGDGSPGECSGTIDFFILAGGGGGSGTYNDQTGGGGGGAGGAVEGVSFQIYAGTHPVTRGGGANGGPGSSDPETAGYQGDPSWINFTTGPGQAALKVEAMGGGGGIWYNGSNRDGESQGGNGGCGGSANGGNPGGESESAPNAPLYPSCPGTVTSHTTDNAPTGGSGLGSGGGGAGLGGLGESPSTDGPNYGGDGGNGGAFPKWPGTDLGPTAYPGTWTAVVGGAGTYGGGGGGANYGGVHGDNGLGGPGGGGAGGGPTNNGIQYTGSGGGGAPGSPNPSSGAEGGPGTVIIRYAPS